MAAESRDPRPADPPYRRHYLVGQVVMLLALWLILSGHWDPFHIGMGVAAVAFVVWINRPVRAVPLGADGEFSRRPIRLLRLIAYLPWLFWQMFTSGIYVAYLALHPRVPISPLLLRFRSFEPGVPAQVVLGNSITLTPGTLTLEIEGQVLTVHALTERTADDFLHGSMPRRVAHLFGFDSEPVLTEVRRIRSSRER